MNVKLVTKNKLQYLKDTLADLKDIEGKNISRDCLLYIGKRVDSVGKDIEYFEALLDILDNK